MVTSLYAAAWIAVLLGPVACVVIARRLKLNKTCSVRYLWVLIGLTAWCVGNGMVLSSDTPVGLCALMVLELLALLPFAAGQKISRLESIGLRSGVYGTLALSLLFYLLVGMEGNIGTREGRRQSWWADRNMLMRDRVFNVNIRALAEEDPADYPAGEMTGEHPLCRRYPALHEVRLITGAAPYWHSFFTRISHCEYAPVRVYPGGPLSSQVPDPVALWEKFAGQGAYLDFGYDSWEYCTLFDIAWRGGSGGELWRAFAVSAARSDLLEFLSTRLGAERETGVQAFVFGPITEGQLAVFAMQRISGRDFDEYHGSNAVIREHLREDIEPRRIIYLQPLRELLKDRGAREELAAYFMKR